MVSDVEDVARSHVLAMEHAHVERRYLVCNHVSSWAEVCDMLRAMCPDAPVPTELEAGGELPRMRLTNDRMCELLGKSPTPVRDTIQKTVNTLREHGFLKH